MSLSLVWGRYTAGGGPDSPALRTRSDGLKRFVGTQLSPFCLILSLGLCSTKAFELVPNYNHDPPLAQTLIIKDKAKTTHCHAIHPSVT